MDIDNIKDRNELVDYFVELGFKKGAEIGVEQGLYSEVICKAGLELFAIDAWQAYKGYRDHVNQKKLDKFHEAVKILLKPYVYSGCGIIKGFSLDIVKQFEDESLDFVYIDCNHEFQNVTNDIAEWGKKVRKGGIIALHDFKTFEGKHGLNSCHVKYVVEAWVKAHDIELHVTKESNPSAFWIKK